VPIPKFDANGFLPSGVHDASLAEVRERFGRFQATDRRVRLQRALEAYLTEAKASGLVDSVIVNGSFTTAEARPGDVDIIVVLAASVDVAADLRPDQYNVLSARRIKKRHSLDARVALATTASVEPLVEFFAQVRGRPALRKGMVRVNV
jgi:hypothetical protein